LAINTPTGITARHARLSTARQGHPSRTALDCDIGVIDPVVCGKR
jgi:hypothetical protein